LPVTLGDGTVVSLRKPSYSSKIWRYGPLDPGTTLSPRVTPQMIGLGLVEQIHPADILALADPDDRDGDGISGKAQIVLDDARGELTLGRFGWKAQTPTIRQQSADAFAGDIGISTPDVPRTGATAPQAQTGCLAMPTGVQERLGRRPRRPIPVLDLVTFYSQNLAVPARRDVGEPDVLAGKRHVLRDRLRRLPHAEIRHPPRRAQQGAEFPADLALFGLPAARHGRRSGGRPARRRRRPAANGVRRRSGASD
jgi:CxxC motif-containing protein (DUF1111 family)